MFILMGVESATYKLNIVCKTLRISNCSYQRWSLRGCPWPRGRPGGHILKSSALALASKPQVLEN